MKADWSQLPSGVLGQIALDHLNTAEDFIMFSCVCRFWYDVSTTIKEIWDPNSRQMPWLMLAEPNIDTTITRDSINKGRRRLYNPSRKKCYNLMLPETFGRRCWGSDHGCVVTLGLDREMHLFNPLTMVRKNLPSQSTFLHQTESVVAKGDYRWIRNCYIHKVRVFKMPRYGNSHQRNLSKNAKYQLVVMAIHGEFDWLSYAMPGDPSWRLIETTTLGSNVDDVACCNDLILILCYKNQMVLNVVRGDRLFDSSRPVSAVDFKLSPQSLFLESRRFGLNMFESFGDLLMVARYKIDQDLGDLENDIHYLKEWLFNEEIRVDERYWFYKTERFQVFKFDFQIKVWKELNDLGDRALFVGENGCISVQASTITNCRRNSIYFSDDEVEQWDRRQGLAGHDLGVYSMTDGSIQPVYEGEDMHSRFSCPFWFMPKFNFNSI